MKITQPITVAGYYCQSDGKWQSAQVVTDGVEVAEILSSQVGGIPDLRSSDLNGVETALGQSCDGGPADFGQAPVVTEYRTSDLAMGGQGAPLHPFYLHAVSRAQDSGPVVYLLVEDVISLVWVDPRVPDPTDARAITAFETGPGLGPIRHLPQAIEKGDVVDGALELFLDDPYFRRLPPKRVDRTSFSHLLTLVNELDPKDARTTLLGMAATSVLLGLEHLPVQPSKFILAGEGGVDPLLYNLLEAALDAPIEVFAHPETVQAQSTAFLAARVVRGLPTTAPHTTGVAAAVGGGMITESA